jgi:hypothetical protein
MACEIIAPSPSSHPTRPQKIVISCFDKSTNMVKPWAEAGYLCYCVDIQHSPGENRTGNIIKVGADIRDWLPPRDPIAFAAFFPLCTDVAVSGARWFKDKGIGSLINALSLFDVSVKLRRMVRSSVHDREPREHCLDLLAETGLHI